jgi:hypothetical protein
MGGGLLGRVATLAGALCLMLLGASCGGHATAAPRETVHYGQGALKEIPCTPTRAGRNCGGLLPAAKGLSDQLQLDQRTVVAGRTIKGTLTVRNNTSRAISLLSRRCRPPYQVALTNKRGLFFAAFPMPCHIQRLLLEPGSNTFPVTVPTTYGSCVADRQTSADQPLCISRPKMSVPPLPPGRYLAVLIGLDLALPPPQPIPVTLT